MDGLTGPGQPGGPFDARVAAIDDSLNYFESISFDDVTAHGASSLLELMIF